MPARIVRAAGEQTIAGRKVRGKSELRRAVRRVIPGRGDPTDQWHRKHTARRGSQGLWKVRVKRCGKSAPRGRQRTWQAKPRTEQGQIGRRSRTARPKPPGRLLEAASDRGPRGMIVALRRP